MVIASLKLKLLIIKKIMIVKAQGLLYNNCEEGDRLESQNNIIRKTCVVFYLIDKLKLYC